MNQEISQRKLYNIQCIFCINPYRKNRHIFVHNFTFMDRSFMYPGCAWLPGGVAQNFTFSNWLG